MSIADEYKKWDRRFRRAYRAEKLEGPVSKGWRMAQFFADVTPEEAARAIAARRDARG